MTDNDIFIEEQNDVCNAEKLRDSNHNMKEIKNEINVDMPFSRDARPH